MFLLEDTVIVSASDITQAGQCEFAFLRRCDVAFGRNVEVPPLEDEMLKRAARLGDEHEARQLASYRAQFGEQGVREIERPAPFTREGIEQRADETTRALRAGDADVVFQATFFDPELRQANAMGPGIGFVGFADFIQSVQADDGTRVWQVQDTKLARTARVAALLQIAAYGEQIERIGAAVHDKAVLILGDGSRSAHRLADIAPVYRSRRERLCDIIALSWTRGEVTAWGDPDIHACGRCEVCEPEIIRTRDTLLVAGMRVTQRAALAAVGIHTIDELAQIRPGQDIPGITASVLQRLAMQARVQLESERTGKPSVRVVSARELAAIPEPNEGDLFFDFEGDPMYREVRGVGKPVWGIDYLFGMVDSQEEFTPLWAHSLAEERAALLKFLELVAERRAKYPDMRIYHYASYERTHLLSIAARHGVGETEVDDLLRQNVLVDLYPIVKKALKVGSRSYSIKKLEPLYMGDEFRDEEGVVSGAQSVTEYAEAVQQLVSEDATVRLEGERRLQAIADYNRYDCVSTLRLRDWLLSIAREHNIDSAADPGPDPASLGDTAPELDVSDTAAKLLELGEQADPADPARAQALRLAASAIDYHEREQKSFWWAHFSRLTDPIEDWADTRDVVVVDETLSTWLEDWYTPPRARKQRRIIELRGTIAPGSSLSEGQMMFAVYEQPAPFPQPGRAVGMRAARQVKIVERGEEGVIIEESLPDGAEPWSLFPIALTPGPPPRAGSQKEAIEQWGSELIRAHSEGREVKDPVFDLLRRSTPRFLHESRPVGIDSDIALETADGDPEGRVIGAVVASLRALDRSFLAVQGPPGTGKTYLASRVIKRLAEEDGWRIGIVAQSHKVVEHVLAGVVAAGLDPAVVGKVPQNGKLAPEATPPTWTVLRANGHQAFLNDSTRSSRGAVIGGTAWDFSNPVRFARGDLDLLVVDEAGQFSIAPTIAASVAASRLLLLGDPQQLPQVSQGSHPEPVDTSALGWLINDHDTLPPELGYFLASTRRMHPELAQIDSKLSYEGRLHAHPSASDRSVVGAGEPGLTWHPVDHRGNTTRSPEEADEVVRIIRAQLSAELHEVGKTPRPVTPHDFIVVAAYNAQVECVTQALHAAGLDGVRVGTVDKFQGQEALIAIVTLAASSPGDIPRGLDFLLMRNRLNVAISRAQWASHLVSSKWLGGVGLPTSPGEVSALAGYLLLTEAGSREKGGEPKRTEVP